MNIKFIIALILIISLLQSSCTSQPLIPDLKMGMREEQWKQKDATLIYPWKIGDTIINVGLSLNGDGLKEGSLRTISFDLTNNEGILQANKDYSVDTLMEYEKVDIYISSVCSKQRFNLVFYSLKSRLGTADSVIYETQGKGDITEYINSLNIDPVDKYLLRREGKKNKQVDSVSRVGGIDTIQITYYFHDDTSLLLLKRTGLHDPSLHIPFEYFEDVQLHFVSKNYESELALLLKQRKENLTPANFVEVYIEANVESKYKVDEQDGFYLFTSVYPQCINYVEDKRNISEIKGHAIIYDQFGDSLYSCPDLLIKMVEPIHSYIIPGIDFLLNEQPTFISTETQTFHYVNFQKLDVPSKLKDAIATKKNVKAKFISEAILFTNGSVLK